MAVITWLLLSLLAVHMVTGRSLDRDGCNIYSARGTPQYLLVARGK